VEIAERFKPQEIAYDPWNLRDLVTRLTSAGLPMVEFRQGPKSYHPAMQETERLYLERNFRHGGDAVLNWCASNVVPRKDENLNLAPDKKRSADKIDDACALFMAVGAMQTAEPQEDISEFLKNPIIA
jgi:phage terminase large subunit-like protein